MTRRVKPHPEHLLTALKLLDVPPERAIMVGDHPMDITLGKGQLYQGTSRIEAIYYRMSQFQNVYTWKGAYHFSADFAHWYGWAHLQMSLIEIKEEARKLRELNKLKKQ
jgi:histidinol phosphatase-like enzyme